MFEVHILPFDFHIITDEEDWKYILKILQIELFIPLPYFIKDKHGYSADLNYNGALLWIEYVLGLIIIEALFIRLYSAYAGTKGWYRGKGLFSRDKGLIADMKGEK
jgi:hypothetical protein